ncbi:MAG: hypothetical protein JO236_16315 [Mycobacterium sp.]|uniref:hypothetical protein n=1 Tax=Mycobacterium sp. TaxID=1785 RepID=UPI001EC3D317|nr:hypothetical protein [Mycobacterium sp.]MBW0019093.1 hypothetical protein [Mycobacterium sp.]
MTETLLFFGEGSDGVTIWTSRWSGSHLSFGPIAASEVVSLAGRGNALQVPGPVLFALNTMIFAPSGSNDLLVWNTHNSDSTSHWTHDVFNDAGNTADQFNPQGFCAALHGSQPLVFFNGTFQTGTELISVQELFSTDGTLGGTKMIPGPVSNLDPSSLAMVFMDFLDGQSGQLFFAGYDGSDYVLFGCAGSTPVAPVFPAGSGVVNPAYLTMAQVGPLTATQVGPITELSPKQSLFMSAQDAQDASGPISLWQYQEAGELTKIVPAHGVSSNGLQPCNLTPLLWQLQGAYHSALLFSGLDDDNNTGLWMSLGNAGPTTQIPTPTPHDAPSSDAGVYPFNLTAFDDRLWFTGYDTYIGGSPSERGLFVYDPVNNPGKATQIVHSSQLAFDPGFDAGWAGNGQTPAEGFGLNQTTMTVFDNDLFFSASEPSSGVANLWRANLTFDSHGSPKLTPAVVASVAQTGLRPFSLTTVSL